MAEKTVLIIDEESERLDSLKERIGSAGFKILSANDGLSGLNLARTKNPDLIIMDIMIPKLNGFKVARFLKFDDNYKHIPIVFLTARAEEHDKQLGKDVGGDLYITKPFNDEELLESIHKLTTA
ncbi:MAG: response regulator [bacterium]|nr:response regulator [bacterium]